MPIVQNPFRLPNPSDPLPIEQIIERNLDLYHDNLRAVAAEYGGKLVTNKKLAGLLLGAVNRYFKRTGKLPDRLMPPEYPLEEFVPLQIKFTVMMPPGVPLEARRWYFVRKARTIGMA